MVGTYHGDIYIYMVNSSIRRILQTALFVVFPITFRIFLKYLFSFLLLFKRAVWKVSLLQNSTIHSQRAGPLFGFVYSSADSSGVYYVF